MLQVEGGDSQSPYWHFPMNFPRGMTHLCPVQQWKSLVQSVAHCWGGVGVGVGVGTEVGVGVGVEVGLGLGVVVGVGSGEGDAVGTGVVPYASISDHATHDGLAVVRILRYLADRDAKLALSHVPSIVCWLNVCTLVMAGHAEVPAYISWMVFPAGDWMTLSRSEVTDFVLPRSSSIHCWGGPPAFQNVAVFPSTA